MMLFDDHLIALEAEGERFVDAVTRAAPSDPVPTCPGWTIRDLVHHQGEVHRWAAGIVAGALTNPGDLPDDFLGPLPGDDELASWLAGGHAALVATLRAAPADLQCFTFLHDSPAPRQFWARRQVHETGMHRVDAQSACGTITAFDPAVAADGIDEMLTGFIPRKNSKLRSETPVTLQVIAADTPGAWHVAIGPEPPATERTSGRDGAPADCTVRGPASDVYRALWNRGGLDPLAISGDTAVLELFRETVKIRWS